MGKRLDNKVLSTDKQTNYSVLKWSNRVTYDPGQKKPLAFITENKEEKTGPTNILFHCFNFPLENSCAVSLSFIVLNCCCLNS